MDNAEIVWNALMEEIKNPYGVAGLMGNLFAESSLNPLCKTGGISSESGADYARKVMSGEIGKAAFSKDNVAFGIAQWRYWSRKEQLYSWAAERLGIGDLETQIEFLLYEIKSYKTVWNTLLNAKTVKEASDIVLERYERPANVGEAAKMKRQIYGEGYFSVFAKVTNSPEIKEPVVKTEPMVVTTAPNVLFRAGNGKEYAIIGRSNSVSGEKFKWVATSKNNWHAVVVKVKNKDRVVWMCGDFCEVI